MSSLIIAIVCTAALCLGQTPTETAPQGDTFKFESKVNVVLVPVLVRDAHGKPVGDLKKEDFEVFDKDKPQTLTGFTLQTRAGLTAAATAGSAPTPSAPAPKADVVPQRFIVFLFDDFHLDQSDLATVQKAATRMLDGSLSETDMAAVLSMSGRTNSGMIRDRAKLAEAIAALRSLNLYRPVGHNCPDVSYYQADLIVNKNDPEALNAATVEALSCAHLDARMRTSAEQMARSAATQALALGEQGTRSSLLMIRAIVKKMGGLPGQHTLILVSPGFLSVSPEAYSEKSELIDLAAQANVTISALDARGLYTTSMDASESGAPTQVMELKSRYKSSSMSADEDVMAELADGTGGTYFHNSNDVAGGLRQLAQAPDYLYLLEFSPQGVKQDGAYHKLKVKVSRAGLKLQARHGYFAPKAAKKK